MIEIMATRLSIALAVMVGIAVGIVLGRRQATAPRINSEYFDLLWTALTAIFFAFLPLLFLGVFSVFWLLDLNQSWHEDPKAALAAFGSLFAQNAVFALIAAPSTVASYFFFKSRTRKAPTP